MLIIPLNTEIATPLYEQIYRFMKSEIQAGRLAFGDKLPSTRNLASHLGVSRNTVDMAYGQLLSEGYIESLPKRGYFVCQISHMARISHSSSSIIPKKKAKQKSYLYDFSPFAVDLSHFPYNTWRRLSRNCLNDDNGDLFLLGDSQGEESLRKAICSYLHDSRGVNCTEEQIIVGAGIDYLLQLLTQILGENVKIAMENPGYKRACDIFTGLGVKTCAVSLDKSGMIVDELLRSGSDISYVTPSHQYPLGIVMPVKRRLELLNWASLCPGRYIIEDDHDSEFRYKGKPIPALAGMDRDGAVIYMGTFSKAIAPAIRVAYMVLPEELLSIYRERFPYYSSTVSRIDQTIITHFIEDGYFERHLNKMRKIYKGKHDLMLKCLKPFANHIDILGANAGLHFVVRVHTEMAEEDLLSLGERNAVKLYGLKKHFIKPPKKVSYPSLLLGYANLTEEEIRNGTALLFSILKPILTKESRREN